MTGKMMDPTGWLDEEMRYALQDLLSWGALGGSGEMPTMRKDCIYDIDHLIRAFEAGRLKGLSEAEANKAIGAKQARAEALREAAKYLHSDDCRKGN
jgi:hypothetical protein